MSAGTVKYPKFIPVHAIILPIPLTEILMAYHAITGCGTASQFSDKGTKTTCAWKGFQEKPYLLNEIGGSAQCCKEALGQSEQCVCHLYGYGDLHSINQVRLKLFVKGKCSVDCLPPTQDAIHFHLMRANYPTFIGS